MPTPAHVHLGPLLKAIAEGARWQTQDSFPAYQGAAEATECVLSFVCTQGQWGRYLPRLRGYVNEREGALGEIWTAQLLSLRGATIVAWEPERVRGLPGDLEVVWPGTPSVFIETKRPQWKGELNQVEVRGDRGKLPKYLQAEVRSLDPTERVLYVAREALPTLPADQPTLLVAVDNLFMSPVEMPLNIVDHRVQRGFSEPGFSKLGGIWLVHLRPTEDGIEPRTHLIANDRANKPCALPETVRRALVQKRGDPPMARFLPVILSILAAAVIVLSVITFELVHAVQDLTRSQGTVIARTGAILCSDVIRESVQTIFPCLPGPVP